MKYTKFDLHINVDSYTIEWCERTEQSLRKFRLQEETILKLLNIALKASKGDYISAHIRTVGYLVKEDNPYLRKEELVAIKRILF